MPVDDSIVAEGQVEPIHYAEIVFSAGGDVTNILVKEGDHVKKGDLLAERGGGSFGVTGEKTRAARGCET